MRHSLRSGGAGGTGSGASAGGAAATPPAAASAAAAADTKAAGGAAAGDARRSSSSSSSASSRRAGAGGLSPSASGCLGGGVQGLEAVWESLRLEGQQQAQQQQPKQQQQQRHRPQQGVAASGRSGDDGGAASDSSSSIGSESGSDGDGVDAGGGNPNGDAGPAGRRRSPVRKLRDVLAPLRPGVTGGGVTGYAAAEAAAGDSSTQRERLGLPRLSVDGAPQQHYNQGRTLPQDPRWDTRGQPRRRRCAACGGWEGTAGGSGGSGGAVDSSGGEAARARARAEPHRWDPEHLIVNGAGGAFLHPTHVFRCAAGAKP
jgi:hypothetical protein